MATPNERSERPATYLGLTVSTCPVCLALSTAKVIVEEGRVFLEKRCLEHGPTRALVSEDVTHYLRCRDYARPGWRPQLFGMKVDRGCPRDCGLCPDHEQHTCHPIVEVTDCCNLECPICMADNRQRGQMSVRQFQAVVDGLVAAEGELENITLSGGEPSLHPELWELVTIAERPEVRRVSLVTNGLRIASDLEFCRQLRDRNVYVILQWDGFDDDTYRRLRGRPLRAVKERALAHLADLAIPTQLVFVAARGVNEDQLGRTLRLMLAHENILSLAVQPLRAPARTSAAAPHLDPQDRLTVAGAIRAMAAQSDGLLREDDFFPLPCPNPECVSLTYLLRLDDGGFVPFPRFVDMRRHLRLLSQSATIAPDRDTEEALHEIINDLWSTAGEVPDSERITGALRRAAREMFTQQGERRGALVRATDRQAKSVFIHHYMDQHNFDLSRVVKCCHHYPRPDGRLVPVCSFNLFHREHEGPHAT